MVMAMPASSAAARQRNDKFGRIGIGRAVRLMMEILELADDREAAFQHLDIELGGDRLQFLGAEPQGEAIHDLPPGPETVGARAGALGKPRHQALMGMGMDVRHGGKRDARRPSARPDCPALTSVIMPTASISTATSFSQPVGSRAVAKCSLRGLMGRTILYIQPYTSGFDAPDQSCGSPRCSAAMG